MTVDDAEAGVTEVVRGCDLLSSAPRQMYLQSLLGFSQPEYGHIPMLLSSDGRRLSKRDRDLDMGVLRNRMTAQALIGKLSFAAGLTDTESPISPSELATVFQWERLKKDDIFLKEL